LLENATVEESKSVQLSCRSVDFISIFWCFLWAR
jgi:hypothetical protein